jgi:hypothetical protein
MSVVRDFYPGRRVIAGLGPAADFAIDARAEKAACGRRAEQQMIDAQPGIALESIAKVIPKSIDALARMHPRFMVRSGFYRTMDGKRRDLP